MANQIKIDEGTFDDESAIYQVRVVDGILNINDMGARTIQRGYGASAKEAIDDFIRRNPSDVLDIIYKQEK